MDTHADGDSTVSSASSARSLRLESGWARAPLTLLLQNSTAQQRSVEGRLFSKQSWCCAHRKRQSDNALQLLCPFGRRPFHRKSEHHTTNLETKMPESQGNVRDLRTCRERVPQRPPSHACLLMSPPLWPQGSLRHTEFDWQWGGGKK